MRSFAVYLACYLLKLPLTLQQRTRLVGAILESNNAVPLNDIITTAQNGSLIIDGKEIDYREALNLKEGAQIALDNSVRKLIKEQVASIAGRRGIAEGDTPDKLYFYRAAIWFMLTEEEFYKKLAGL